MINLVVFMRDCVGKQINFDNVVKYNGQCTQLVKLFCQKNGWSIPNGGGEDAWGYRNYRNGFVFVRNTISAVPALGDIIVFNKSINHVSIALPSDSVDLACFGQNYTRALRCSVELHKRYWNVYGWLHWSK